MECNKDEAARAKELAEKRLTEKDIAGAKRIALDALNLFPGLDGLSQLVEIIDMYVAYEKKVCGEVDWYGVLGVEPSADDETIRRQYRKLALSLHPDKNKAVGADGAFKILSEAWSLLSDKVKRAAYDLRQNMRFSYQKATNGMPSMQTGKNGFHKFTSNPSSVRNPTTATNARPRPSPPPPKPDSFWTSCRHCKIYFEYLKVFLNNYLFCHNCRKPLLAIEVPPPPVKGQRPLNPWVSHQQQQGVNNATTDVSEASGRKYPCMETTNFSHVSSSSSLKTQPCSFSKPGGARSVPGPTTSATEAASNLRQASEYLKREHEDTVSEAAARNKSDRPTKRRHIDIDKSARKKKETVRQMAPKSGGCGQGNSYPYQNGSLGGVRTAVPGSKAKNVEDCSLAKLRIMLVKKAQMDIRRKLNGWRMTAASKSSPKEDEVKKTAIGAAEISAASGTKKADDRNSMVNNTHTLEQSQKSAVSADQENFEAKSSEFIKMAVTDPDFHNFDIDRTEESFSENQVWATYDDDDGMPRFYALVRGIISKEPFKIRISWLKSKTNTELGPLDWIDSGFAKTCGEFRLGKQVISEALNSFSHMVRWTKGARGVIQIFPRKGETWALYKNWSPDWNELTPDDVTHKYDMVEVVEDYDEKQGVVVAPLIKVAGFKSLFCQHMDSSKTWTIARQELFRFSHQVPSYLLTGQEAPNAPRGCRELDPASLPSELLQVIQEDEVVRTVEKAENSANTERSEGERIAEGEQHAVADAFATEDDKETGENVNLRFKEPIVTYTRKRTGKKVAGDTDAK